MLHLCVFGVGDFAGSYLRKGSLLYLIGLSSSIHDKLEFMLKTEFICIFLWQFSVLEILPVLIAQEVCHPSTIGIFSIAGS